MAWLGAVGMERSGTNPPKRSLDGAPAFYGTAEDGPFRTMAWLGTVGVGRCGTNPPKRGLDGAPGWVGTPGFVRSLSQMGDGLTNSTRRCLMLFPV